MRNRRVVSQVKLDEIDVEILKSLLKDARTPFSKIAGECGISTPSIIKRFNRLKKSKVIVGTTVRLNLKEIGYNYRLSIDINLDNINETNIFEVCRKLPGFINCTQVVGKYDVHAVVYLKNLEQIEQIRQTIRSQKGVKRIGLTATYEAGIFPENLLIKPTEITENG